MVRLRNRTVKRLCVTNVTGPLLLACFVAIFTDINVFCLKGGEVKRKDFQTKLLSHKVCRFQFLSRPVA